MVRLPEYCSCWTRQNATSFGSIDVYAGRVTGSAMVGKYPQSPTSCQPRCWRIPNWMRLAHSTYSTYPLVMTNIATEHHYFQWNIHNTGWFSMLNYQRVVNHQVHFNLDDFFAAILCAWSGGWIWVPTCPSTRVALKAQRHGGGSVLKPRWIYQFTHWNQ